MGFQKKCDESKTCAVCLYLDPTTPPFTLFPTSRLLDIYFFKLCTAEDARVQLGRMGVCLSIFVLIQLQFLYWIWSF